MLFFYITKKTQYLLFCMGICLLSISGCIKKKVQTPSTPTLSEIPPASLPAALISQTITPEPLMPLTDKDVPVNKTPTKQKSQSKKTISVTSLTDSNEIDFEVSNLTGKTLYVTCFAYQRKTYFRNWRWDKSPVYEIQEGKSVTIDVDTTPDAKDRKNVYGYLGVFPTKKEADDATVELIHDRQKLDLDLLINLKGKKVTIEIGSYGVKGEYIEYDFIDRDVNIEKKNATGINFAVENQSGKPILVTCFVYQKKAKGSWIGATEEKDDMAIWRFDKTPVIKIDSYQVGIISTDTIQTSRDRKFLRGYLAVFNESEEELANQSIFELLEVKHKLNIGQLDPLANKKIIIDVEQYGILEDFFDFVIKPQSKIDFVTLKKK